MSFPVLASWMSPHTLLLERCPKTPPTVLLGGSYGVLCSQGRTYVKCSYGEISQQHHLGCTQAEIFRGTQQCGMYFSHAQLLKRGQIPLVTSLTRYLIYHHAVSIDFITAIQHVRKPAGSKERWGMLGFFEDIKGTIQRKNENRTNKVEGIYFTVKLYLLNQTTRKKSRWHFAVFTY